METDQKMLSTFLDIFTASEVKPNPFKRANLSQLQEYSIQFSVSILNFFQENNT